MNAPNPVSAGPTPAVPDPYVGTVIGERYRILERVGAGGMGLVFRGEHMLMKKTVAIKLLHRELGALDDAARRFEREAQSASRLSHASIVAVTDFGRAAGGELFLIMEYVGGAPLASLLERGRLPVARAVEIARLILRGLAHAHGAGVVHRDLKPANIMVQTHRETGADSVKILDFGIAKMSAPTDPSEVGQGPESVAVIESSETSAVALTRGGMIFGTPSYMAPEQATGQAVDSRADLYACGVILYELLAGRKPFVADDLIKVMALQVAAAPPPFAEVAPDAGIPPAIEAVVQKALVKARGERFQSALEFLEALDRAERSAHLRERLRPIGRGALSVSGRAVTASVDLVRWIRANGKRQRIAGGVLAVVIGLVLFPALCSRDAPPRPRPVAKALQQPLAQVEDKIARGQLAEAKVMLMDQLSKFPKSARIHFQLGTIAFAENEPGDGIEHYRAALALDDGLRGDPALLLNLGSQLDSRTHAQAALDFLVDRIGKPGCKALASLASSDKRAVFRVRAREACDRLDCDDVDRVGSYGLDLAQAKTCAAKKTAIEALGDTGDERAIPILTKAGKDHGGPFGKFLGLGNECVAKDIAAALKKLGAK